MKGAGSRHRLALLALVVVLVGGGYWCWSTASSGGSRTQVVIIENMKFTPAVLALRLGDRVRFENHDLVPHTATAKGGEHFDSGVLTAGAEWAFTPARAGTTPYACLFHTTMEGSLVVTAP